MAETRRQHGGGPQAVRQENAARVLESLWVSEPATAADLMAATGLTRATVLALCRGLAEQGWLRSAQDTRRAGEYAKGRPALRYAFAADAAHVIGVDAGQHTISACVADLRSEVLGRHEFPVDVQDSYEGRDPDRDAQAAERRRELILKAVDAALAAAGVDAGSVAQLVLGVPAPVDAQGRSPAGHNAFWGQMNPDLVTLGAARGWPTVVENDANLAAMAELARSDSRDSFAVLLSGERFGAGLVLQGNLLRQPRGGAGELGMLSLVDGVGSTQGLGSWVREQTQGEGLASVEQVFADAAAGEPRAVEVAQALGERLARICAVLAGPLDLDRVIVAGAVAPALEAVLSIAREALAEHLYAPWLRLEASALGGDAVLDGAVQFAVDQVRRRALAGEPAPAVSGGSTSA